MWLDAEHKHATKSAVNVVWAARVGVGATYFFGFVIGLVVVFGSSKITKFIDDAAQHEQDALGDGKGELGSLAAGGSVGLEQPLLPGRD